MDKMEKVSAPRLDRTDKRLGVLEESCSSMNTLVKIIQKATESSYSPITQVAQSKVNILSNNVNVGKFSGRRGVS